MKHVLLSALLLWCASHLSAQTVNVYGTTTTLQQVMTAAAVGLDTGAQLEGGVADQLTTLNQFWRARAIGNNASPGWA